MQPLPIPSLGGDSSKLLPPLNLQLPSLFGLGGNPGGLGPPQGGPPMLPHNMLQIPGSNPLMIPGSGNLHIPGGPMGMPGGMMGMPPGGMPNFPGMQMPMMNPLAMNLMMRPAVLKQDFPQDVQSYFRTKQCGYLNLDQKPKCRKLDPLISDNFNFLSQFQEGPPPPKPEKPETKEQKIKRLRFEKLAKNKEFNKEQMKEWNPYVDSNVTEDPYKTIIVYKLNYKTTEKTLQKQFEAYGPVKKVRIVRNQITGTGESRGYGFVEFQKLEHFQLAYKNFNGQQIDNTQVYVDFERGRTIIRFRPRRFGGGIGDTRKGQSESLERSGSSHSQKSVEQQKKKHRSVTRSRSKSYSKDRGGHMGKHQHKNKSKSRSRSADQQKSQKDHKKQDHKKGSSQDRDNAPSQKQVQSHKEQDSERDRDTWKERDRERGGDREGRDREQNRFSGPATSFGNNLSIGNNSGSGQYLEQGQVDDSGDERGDFHNYQEGEHYEEKDRKKQKKSDKDKRKGSRSGSRQQNRSGSQQRKNKQQDKYTDKDRDRGDHQQQHKH